MAILSITTDVTGLAGVNPRVVYIETNDTLATVTTTGYLNKSVQQGFVFQEDDMALVSTKTTPSSTTTQVGWLEVSKSGANWSLVPAAAPGSVTLPTIANHIATYTNTTGNLSEDPATAISGGNIQAGLSGTAGYFASFPATAARGSLRFTAANSAGDTVTTITNASQAAARTYTIPDGGQSASSFLLTDSAGTQTIATGSLALTLGSVTATAGNITAGSTAGAGALTSFSGTGSAEFLRIAAIDNAGGNFSTTVSNASSVGQSQTISIPDAGAATANFLLDTGAANILAMQEFVGLQSVLNYSAGTWTRTRLAQGNYAQVKTQADDTTIIGIDITPEIRTAASKGFRLDSFDVIYSIATLALDAHSVVLDRIAYANNVAVSVTSIPITATLATATQANPYLTNATINTPAFDNTADSKYVIEVTVDAGATSDYSFYGIMLRFSQTVA